MVKIAIDGRERKLITIVGFGIDDDDETKELQKLQQTQTEQEEEEEKTQTTHAQNTEWNKYGKKE